MEIALEFCYSWNNIERKVSPRFMSTYACSLVKLGFPNMGVMDLGRGMTSLEKVYLLVCYLVACVSF